MKPLALATRCWLNAWGRIGKAPGFWYQAVERFGPQSGAGRILERRLPNGLVMSCDLADHVQRQIYFQGCYEPVESMLFVRLLRPGMVVIDAGANVGQYTLLASTCVGQSGTVHSFEPMPQNFAHLAEQARRNHLGNVQLNQIALWDRGGKVPLGLDPAVEGNSGSFAVGQGNSALVQADAITIDAYVEMREIPQVDLIKMDIEGSEPFALRGARGTLDRHRPTILMEINAAACQHAGASTAEIWYELVERLGYRAHAIGIHADQCTSLHGLEEIKQQNVIFHVEQLPADLLTGWKFKDALRWARGGAR